MSRVMLAINKIADIDEWVSVVDICCMMLAWVVKEQGIHISQQRRGAASSAVTKINHRFLQHGVGYQSENGRIIRKHSELMHAEPSGGGRSREGEIFPAANPRKQSKPKKNRLLLSRAAEGPRLRGEDPHPAP